MFNLIVKDPRRTPPKRAALDRVTRLVAVRPRTCCAVWQRVGLSIVPGNTQAALGELSETTEDSSGCQQKSYPELPEVLRNRAQPRISQTSVNEARFRSHSLRAKAPYADSPAQSSLLDCSLWKALPSGRRRLRRTPRLALMLNYCGLKATPAKLKFPTTQLLYQSSTPNAILTSQWHPKISRNQPLATRPRVSIAGYERNC